MRRVDPAVRAPSREVALLRVLSNRLLIGRDVDAVELVVGDVAVLPLDCSLHARQHVTGLPGDGLHLLIRQLAGTGNFSLDHELRHVLLLRGARLRSHPPDERPAEDILRDLRASAYARHEGTHTDMQAFPPPSPW